MRCFVLLSAASNVRESKYRLPGISRSNRSILTLNIDSKTESELVQCKMLAGLSAKKVI